MVSGSKPPTNSITADNQNNNVHRRFGKEFVSIEMWPLNSTRFIVKLKCSSTRIISWTRILLTSPFRFTFYLWHDQQTSGRINDRALSRIRCCVRESFCFHSPTGCCYVTTSFNVTSNRATGETEIPLSLLASILSDSVRIFGEPEGTHNEIEVHRRNCTSVNRELSISKLSRNKYIQVYFVLSRMDVAPSSHNEIVIIRVYIVDDDYY